MYMFLIYDCVLVVGMILFIRQGARQGMVKTLAQMVGYILSWGASLLLSIIAAQMIFDAFIKPPVKKSLVNLFTGGSAGESLAVQLEEIVGKIPQPVLQLLGIDSSSVMEFDMTVSGAAEKLSTEVVNQIIAPVILLFLKALLFVVFFVILSFVARRVVNVLGFVNKVPLLGPANAVLGGVLGAGKGLIVFSLVSVALAVAVYLTGGENPFLNEKVINSTFLYRYIYNFSILSMMM